MAPAAPAPARIAWPWYGALGALLIALCEVNFRLVVQPFAVWYIPIIWTGYILLVDSLVRRLGGRPVLTGSPRRLLWLMLCSEVSWVIFEALNLRTRNWWYLHYTTAIHVVDYLIILPAIFATTQLLSCLGFGARWDRAPAPRVGPALLGAMLLGGVLALGGLLFAPRYMYPLVWLVFWFLLDPVLYLRGRASVLGLFAAGRFGNVLQLLAGGLIVGALFEFWNYWAYPKWFYDIPLLGFWKIFEMPLLGYGGYPCFALELYSMVSFAEWCLGFERQTGDRLFS